MVSILSSLFLLQFLRESSRVKLKRIMSDEILTHHDRYEAVPILNRGNVLFALESRNNPPINAFVLTSRTDYEVDDHSTI